MIPKRANSTAFEAGRPIKASGGQIFTLHGHNSGPEQWIQVHDAAAVPDDGAKPVTFFKAEAGKGFDFDFGAHGEAYAAGIAVCNSSTAVVKTAGGADCWFVVTYR